MGGSAHWSPGGDRLAYLEGGDYGPPDIHTVAPDASNDRDWGIAPGSTMGGWAPDGRGVFFPGTFSCWPELCAASVLLELETGRRTDLVDLWDVGPFSPDGHYVLGTTKLPTIGPHGSSNYPKPDYAVALIDLSNQSRQQVLFQDRDARPLRWIDEQTFLVGAEKLPYNPYRHPDCQEWVVSTANPSLPDLVSDECRDGYLSRDGRYVYFVRIRDPGNFPRVGDLYRLDLSDGSETLWMEDALATEIYEPVP